MANPTRGPAQALDDVVALAAPQSLKSVTSMCCFCGSAAFGNRAAGGEHLEQT